MKTKSSVAHSKSIELSLIAIELYKKLLKKNEFVLSKQIFRSSTSVGANLEEAVAAQSRKDFLSKISIAHKEARETKYWLLLLKESKLIKFDHENYLKIIEDIINILAKTIITVKRKTL
jgi:four helix bundle protein